MPYPLYLSEEYLVGKARAPVSRVKWRHVGFHAELVLSSNRRPM